MTHRTAETTLSAGDRSERRIRPKFRLFLGSVAFLAVYAEVPAVQAAVDGVARSISNVPAERVIPPNRCDPIMRYEQSPLLVRTDLQRVASTLKEPSHDIDNGSWNLVGCDRALSLEAIEGRSQDAVVRVDGIPDDCVAVATLEHTPPDSEGKYPVLLAYCPPQESPKPIFSAGE